MMDCTISIDKLWAFIQSMSLSADNQRWLADKLIENLAQSECPYTVDELNRRIDRSEASIAQGRVVSHNDVMAQMDNFIKMHS